MKVSVHYWSWFRDIAGADREEYVLAPGSVLEDALRAIRREHPRFEELRKSTLVAVGLDYRDERHALCDGDEISLFPPVQGG